MQILQPHRPAGADSFGGLAYPVVLLVAAFGGLFCAVQVARAGCTEYYQDCQDGLVCCAECDCCILEGAYVD